jgi:photosystem II stability/assembly factor-like uncharacterized protein
MRRWQQISSPATVLAIAPAADGYLLGTNEGVWHLAAGDRSCKIVSESLRQAVVSAVAAGGRRIFVGAADGMAYSDDAGETWTAAALPGKLQVSQIVTSPIYDRDGIVFAATLQGGVLGSLDGGAAWSFANLGLSDAEAVSLALSPNFALDLSMVVSVGTGAFFSQNLGRTWRLLPIEAAAMPAAGFAFASEVLLVGSETKGLYHSIDRGKSFTKRSAFSSGEINALAVSPDGARIALATPQLVVYSTDFGATWQKTEGRTPRGVLALLIGNDGCILAGTQTDGLWML